MALGILAIAGVGHMVMGALAVSVVQLVARGQMLGRLMSLHAISTRGIGPFGAAQAGAPAEFVGVQWVVAFGAILCLAATVGLAAREPRLRQFSGAGHEGPHLPVPTPALHDETLRVR